LPLPCSTRFPYTTLFRSREIRVPDDVDAIGPMGADDVEYGLAVDDRELELHRSATQAWPPRWDRRPCRGRACRGLRTGTARWGRSEEHRLNSSHGSISYA